MIVNTKIDFRINDNWKPIRAVIERLSEIDLYLADDKQILSGVDIDLSKCDYMGPDAVAIVARVCLVAHYRHIPCVVKLPQGPPPLRSYTRVSGLEGAIRAGAVVPEVVDLMQPVMPLMQFTKATFADANAIIALIKRRQELSDDNEEYLRICVNEVIQNVEDHAQSPIGVLLAARYMDGIHEVRVAVVDAGKGICQTLKRRYPDTTPELSLKRVVEGGYSAKSRRNNAGLGISNLCAIVVDNLGGEIAIVSDSAAAVRTKNRPWNIESITHPFHGTGIFFTLPVLT